MDREIVLECRDVSHWFGTKKVLFEVNIKIIRGEIIGLVGPSGCGKSTLLRAIVGTHPPLQGEVTITPAGETIPQTVTGPGRDRGIVYQQYTLFPFLTARENVALGLMLDQTSIPFRLFQFPKWRQMRKRHLAEAAELLERLGLGDAVRLYPHQMSGGMRQRVAIAQALIMKPEVLLLDEPFGALDEATREELQIMLLTLYQENLAAIKQGEPAPHTILIVTHELNEALYVGDRVLGLSQYWDWKAAGHDACPGATIVYDCVSPVFAPGDTRNFSVLAAARVEIREAAFETDILPPRDQYNLFWKELDEGKGQGVLA